MEGIKITKKQLMDYLKSKDDNAKNRIEYSEYTSNLKKFLMSIVNIESENSENNIYFWGENFNLNKSQLIRLLEKFEIISKQENGTYAIPAINIKRKVKRLFTFLTDKQENKKLIDEETGIGSVGGADGFALSSPYFLGTGLKEKTWQNGEIVKLKDCIVTDSTF